jgi:hypothetical protein
MWFQNLASGPRLPAPDQQDRKAGKKRLTAPPKTGGINIHTSGISRVKRFSPRSCPAGFWRERSGSRGGFETTSTEKIRSRKDRIDF